MNEALGQLLLTEFGPACLRLSADERAPFEHDWRGRTSAAALAVALPQDVASVQALVRFCAAHRVAIVPQGGNTGLCGGSVPTPALDRPQLILSLARMHAIREVDLANDTVTVDAGCTLHAVQTLAAEHGRLFPLSLAAEGSCQIGGNLATNAGGVQVLRYGTMRALALGLEVVMPDGSLLNSLRGLRKDNTGYDLKQLFIGSEGTLGIITAATLRLFPRPRQQTVAWLAVASPAAALDLFHALRTHVGEQISSYELIAHLPLALAVRHIPGARAPLAGEPAWQILLQVDDYDTEALTAVLADAADGPSATGLLLDAVIAQSEQQAQTLWALRENLSEAQRLEGPSLKHDISLPMSQIPMFIARADAALHALDAGVRIVCFGHLGDGNLHYNLFPSRTSANAAELESQSAALSHCVLDLVAELGGSFSAEHGVGQFKVAALQHYRDPLALALMQSLKRAWDPDQIMNPGKLFALR